MKLLALSLVAAAALSACATTDEIPMAKNVVRIETRTGGLLYVGQTADITMEKAAQATLARGYERFILQDVSADSGSELVGISSTGSANFYGNSAWGSSYSTPIYGPTASAGVTVVMLNPGDRGYENALVAAEILAE